MWCAWHLRNDMLFGSGKEFVMGSAKFLVSDTETLSSIKMKGNQEESDKGKVVGVSINCAYAIPALHLRLDGWGSFAPAPSHYHHFLAMKVYRKPTGFSSSLPTSPKCK
jgi:hypothetical protein